MAGIACARRLRSAGINARLIDKGRGIGGRVATRRANVDGKQLSFDHGTQYLDQSEDTAMIAALTPGAVAPWAISPDHKRLVGTPEMTSLPKALAQGLDVTLNTRVTHLIERDTYWDIETDQGATRASHLVITTPAPQIAPLIGTTHPLVERVSLAQMAPCLTLMAGFDADTPKPFITNVIHNECRW